MNRSSYSDKLKDPRWQKKRLEIMQRDDFCCQMCFDGQSTLHVHHKLYKKGAQPWEYDDCELVTVCESCHEDAHRLMDQSQRLMASLSISGTPSSIQNALPVVAGLSGADPNKLIGSEYFCPIGYMAGEIARHFSSANAYYLFELLDLLETYTPGQIVRSASAVLIGEDRIEPQYRSDL